MFSVGTPPAGVSLPCTAVIFFPPLMSVPSLDVGNGRRSFRYFASSGHSPSQGRFPVGRAHDQFRGPPAPAQWAVAGSRAWRKVNQLASTPILFTKAMSRGDGSP